MNYTKGNWQQGRYGNNQFEVLTDKQIAVVKTSLDDANLICAAPQMYKALKKLIVNHYDQVALWEAEQAIAKAEGK